MSKGFDDDYALWWRVIGTLMVVFKLTEKQAAEDTVSRFGWAPLQAKHYFKKP